MDREKNNEGEAGATERERARVLHAWEGGRGAMSKPRRTRITRVGERRSRRVKDGRGNKIAKKWRGGEGRGGRI